MVGGWFIGDFEPSIFRSPNVEVSIKEIECGEGSPSHWHLRASEITVIVDGILELNGFQYKKGNIILIEPGEAAIFKIIQKVTLVVVKLPSVPNDKFFIR